jgi:PilZ domain
MEWNCSANSCYKRVVVSSENRQNSRVRIPLDAIVRSQDAYFYAETRDMSETGLSLHTRKPFAVGTRLSLVLGQPPRLPKINVEGVVKWLSEGKGVGIEFAGLGTEDRAAISAFLNSLSEQNTNLQ